MKKSSFSRLHPLTVFCYYLFSGVVVMTVWNPLVLLLFAAQAAAFLIFFDDKIKPAVWISYLALFLVVVATNMLFNARGRQILFYLLDRPVTKESLMWGVTGGLSLCAVLLVFRAASLSLSASDFLYIFSKSFPKTALLISMATGFVGLFTRRVKDITVVLKTKNIDTSSRSLKKRCADAVTVLNALITFSLEEALTTADSMKARGYGACKRGSYRYRRFRKKDGRWLFLQLCIFLFIIVWYYKNPVQAGLPSTENQGAFLLYAAAVIYLILPFAEELRFCYKWRSSEQKI